MERVSIITQACYHTINKGLIALALEVNFSPELNYNLDQTKLPVLSSKPEGLG